MASPGSTRLQKAGRRLPSNSKMAPTGLPSTLRATTSARAEWPEGAWEIQEGSTWKAQAALLRCLSGEAMLGRVINPLGLPLDGKGR